MARSRRTDDGLRLRMTGRSPRPGRPPPGGARPARRGGCGRGACRSCRTPARPEWLAAARSTAVRRRPDRSPIGGDLQPSRDLRPGGVHRVQAIAGDRQAGEDRSVGQGGDRRGLPGGRPPNDPLPAGDRPDHVVVVQRRYVKRVQPGQRTVRRGVRPRLRPASQQRVSVWHWRRRQVRRRRRA